MLSHPWFLFFQKGFFPQKETFLKNQWERSWASTSQIMCLKHLFHLIPYIGGKMVADHVLQLVVVVVAVDVVLILLFG